MKIGTLTTGSGVTTVITLQYVPEEIGFMAATQLTSFKAEVLGEGVICDLDAAGLSAVGAFRRIGKPATAWIIPLADGIIKGKLVTLTFVNSGAQTPDIYAWGDNNGDIYVRTNKTTVLLNNNTSFEKFGALFLPSLAAGDKVTITYEDGLTQIWERDDISWKSGAFQNIPGYVIDNLSGNIKRAQVLTAATQTAFLMDFKQA